MMIQDVKTTEQTYLIYQKNGVSVERRYTYSVQVDAQKMREAIFRASNNKSRKANSGPIRIGIISVSEPIIRKGAPA